MSMIRRLKQKEATEASAEAAKAAETTETAASQVSAEEALAAAFDALQDRQIETVPTVAVDTATTTEPTETQEAVTVAETMATETVTSTEQSRANDMMKNLEAAQSSAAVVEAMNQAENESNSETVKPTVVMNKATGRLVNVPVVQGMIEPMSCPYLVTRMGNCAAYTVRLTMLDLMEYTGFEQSLHLTENGKLMADKSIPLAQRFQRVIDKTRAEAIADYLLSNRNRYFPPLIGVPNIGTGLYEQLSSISDGVDSGVVGANGVGGTITLTQHSVLIGDGQHRLKGIEIALKRLEDNLKSEELNLETYDKNDVDKLNEQSKRLRLDEMQSIQYKIDGLINQLNSLRRESMPVVIVAIDPNDIQAKQQLFSDINKTPRKVSKAIATLYDHASTDSQLAKYCASIPTNDFGDGYSGSDEYPAIGDMVYAEGTSVKKSEKKALTLTNLISLIQPDSKHSEVLRRVAGDPAVGERMDYETVGQLVSVIVNGLPEIDTIRGGKSYGDVTERLVCYGGTFWKAMGMVVSDLIEKEGTKLKKADFSRIVIQVGDLMQYMLIPEKGDRNSRWNGLGRMWHNSDMQVCDYKGHATNNITTVRNMSKILLKQIVGDEEEGEGEGEETE